MSLRTSFSSVDPSWTVRELFGGILSPLRRNGLKRRKRTGAQDASRRFQATMSSFPCRSERKHRNTFWYLDSVKFPEDQTATEEVERNRPTWLNSSLTHEPQAHAVLRSVGLVARRSPDSTVNRSTWLAPCFLIRL